MIRRYLTAALDEFCFSNHKMALVSGPRQCGKTTLAKELLRRRRTGAYCTWDETKFRRIWAKDPSATVPRTKGARVPLLVLDEIHKHRLWKRNLKGVFDTLTEPCDILVTGSARLNVYTKGSDSLLGRHFSFRLHPFSMRELKRPDLFTPDAMMDALFTRAERRRKADQRDLDTFMTFGPFPEPFLAQDSRKAQMWRRNREQLVIREDLRDISHLADLSRIEMMTALLPERVGSLFSAAAMREDLEASFDSINRWVRYLRELYYLFEIKPWSRQVARSLRRQGKVYLWDYAAVPDRAARFENLVAYHLLKACHFWTDTGEGKFELFFVRTKEGHEIDFLIVRDGVPWLPVEVKYSDTDPSPSWGRFAPFLPCKRGLQLVYQPEWQLQKRANSEILVAGAAEALGYFA